MQVVHGIIEEIDIRQKFALFEIRTFSTPFSPKQPLRNTDLDSVSMAAFGHKQRFAYFDDPCILCGDGVL